MAEKNTPGGLLAFLIGLGMGTVMAILYAPQPGDETRELISQAVKHGKEYVSDATQQFKSEIGISVAGVKDKLQDAMEAGKNAYWEEIRQTKDEPSV
ncbi:MAG TPA: YtxH domain-containing protein [Candidatus Acidoferrales bacterium]|nr:YtxH domain-containing protein [Candidatus Acidoferrales bacterium]